MKISLVIPCYNEEGNIDSLVKKCERFLSSKNNQLVLVNNGSSDDTEKKIDEHSNISNLKKVNVSKNQGFGYGVLQGLLASSGEVLSYTHADMQTDPNDVLEGARFIENENDTNFLIKGKRINKIKNNWNTLDLFVSYSMTIFESLLFQQILYDIHAQPVIFHKDFFKLWKLPPNNMILDVYTYAFAKKKGYKILRFPVTFDKEKRLSGKGNNDTLVKTIKGSIEHLKSSIVLRFNLK